MKIAVVNCSKTYNLAAKKLAVYYRAQHDVEEYNPSSWPTPIDLHLSDQVLASAIFSWDLPRLRTLVKDAQFYGCDVQAGGPAVIHSASALEREIEADSIQTGLHACEETAGDYPMAWTSRGCIRDCPWCIVPSIEGRTMQEKKHLEYAPLILDNNFLACLPAHQERVMQSNLGDSPSLSDDPVNTR